MIHTVVVGHGLAGRAFHCPLIRRQPELRLHGVVARDPTVRAEAVKLWNVQGYASLDEALDDPQTEFVVIATPHNSMPSWPFEPSKQAGIAWLTRSWP